MENSSQGSFIPKRSTGKVAPRRASKRIYIFSYIAYAFFFGTLLSVAGIFFLGQQAESKLNGKIQELAAVGAEFDREDMRYVSHLSNKLQTAEVILNDHLAPSLLFDELEEVVVKTIQLTGIEYARGESATKVTFKGSANTFDALLFQRDIMGESPIFAAATVSDVKYGNATIEAVGNSARSQIASVETEAKLTFTFEDESLRDQIGYSPRNTLEVTVSEDTDVATSSSTQN